MESLQTPTQPAADPSAPRAAGPTTRAAAVVTAMAAVIGLFLRWRHLGRDSLWFDEGYTAWMSSHGPREIVRLIRADTAPPVYYILLHGWTLLFGRSEVGLRSFSAVMATLTLPLVWDLARRTLKDRWAVAAAATLWAFSMMGAWYAQEARTYAMMALLCVAAFYAAARRLEGGGWAWVIASALALAGAMYAHNMSALYAVSLAAAWTILPGNGQALRSRARDLLVVAAVSALLWLPWAVVAMRSQVKMVDRQFWVAPPTGDTVIALFAELAGVAHYWDWDRFIARLHLDVTTAPSRIGLGLLVAAILLSTLATHDRRRRRTAIALVTFTLLPPFLVTVYSCWRTPLLMDRIFLPTAAVLPIVLAFPLSSRKGWVRSAGAALAAVAVVLSAATWYGWAHGPGKEDWRGAARYVASLPDRPRVLVFISNEGQLLFDYYYKYRPGETITAAPQPFFAIDPPRTMRRVLSPADTREAEAAVSARPEAQVVLVWSHAKWSDPQDRFLALLTRMRGKPAVRKLHDVTLYVFPPRQEGER